MSLAANYDMFVFPYIKCRPNKMFFFSYSTEEGQATTSANNDRPCTVQISEWIYSRVNPGKNAEIVPGVCLDWPVPTVQRLWFGWALCFSNYKDSKEGVDHTNWTKFFTELPRMTSAAVCVLSSLVCDLIPHLCWTHPMCPNIYSYWAQCLGKIYYKYCYIV